MPSPFPGMDPYVEATGAWQTFHHAFLSVCADQLNERLPRAYAAVLNERVQLLGSEEPQVPTRVAGPHVTLLRNPGMRPGPGSGSASVATLEPQTLPQEVEWLDPPRQLYVEVVTLPEQRVVSHIELLSPSNKRRGLGDRIAYLAKRRSVLHHRVHLVEVDLLLGGDRLPLLAPLPAGDYFAFVTRREAPHQCEVYAWGLREALPTIPVPLEPENLDTPLDLGPAFARVYDRGRYPQLLRYDASPPPSLRAADRTWAEGLAKSVVP